MNEGADDLSSKFISFVSLEFISMPMCPVRALNSTGYWRVLVQSDMPQEDTGEYC